MGLAGIAIQAHVTNHVTIYQARVPSRLRGRVVGVSSMLAQSSIALGTLAMGAAGSAIGVHVAIAIAGVAVVAMSLTILVRRGRLRTFGTDGRPLSSE